MGYTWAFTAARPSGSSWSTGGRRTSGMFYDMPNLWVLDSA